MRKFKNKMLSNESKNNLLNLEECYIKMLEQPVLNSIQEEVDNEYINNKSLILNATYRKFLELPVKKKTVLMEVRDGKSFSGNVRSLYLGMLRDERFKDWKFYISYQEEKIIQKITSNLPEHHNTFWIQRNSPEYMKRLATCEYLINNSTFLSCFTKREDQIYINTWHGTPLKYMGRDLPGIKDNQNVLRNFLMADYILSPNNHTTNIFKDKYQLEGIYEGTLLEGGYPRIDETFNINKEELFSRAEKIGIKLCSNKKTLLYTPTWRGNKVDNPNCSFESLEAELKIMKKYLPDWNILIKVHPFVAEMASERIELRDVLIPDTEDVNEWLSVTDLLITDYSSIFFDFLVTDKPIVFYCPDSLNYEQNRGLYFQEEDLPGIVVTNVYDLIEAIRKEERPKKYDIMKSMMVPYEDGSVTSRYIETIFFNSKLVKTIKCNTTKKKLLLYAGSMGNNGITTALINLCNTLDSEEFDITVFLGGNVSNERADNIRRLPKNVRLLFNIGYPVYSKEERLYDKIMMKLPNEEHYQKYFNLLKSAYRRESNRLFPNIHFDVAIDYSGYAYYWAKYILFAPAKRHIVYLHNDIVGEWRSKENHRAPLTGLMLLYPLFDSLVNVSPSLEKVNGKKLQKIISPKKHVTAPNLLDLKWKENNSANRETVISFDGRLLEKTTQFKVDKKTNIVLQKKPNEKAGYTVNVYPYDNIVSQATYYKQGKCYFRLQINGIESGWYLDQGQLLEVGLKIIDRQLMDCPGKVLPHKGVAYTISTGDFIPLTSAGMLKRLHHASVQIEEKLITEQDEFYIVSSGEWKGILKAKDVKLNEQGCYLLGKEIPIMSQSVQRFLKVTSKDAPIYSAPKGLPNSQIISKTSLIEEQYLYNYWETENGYGKFYEYRTENNQKGWIDSRDVEIVSTPFIPIRQIENYPHEVNGSSVLCYQNLKALECDEKEWISHIQGVLYVHEKLWTQRGIFYKVSGDYEGLIEERAVGNRVIEGRMKDIDGNFVYPFKKGRHHYMTMGRLSPEKNHKALIEGFSKFLSENPRFKGKVDLSILGEGILKDELKDTIKKLHLEDSVFLLGHHNNTADLLKYANGFIFPSLYEGQGLALIEAMMMEIPVAATDIPVLRQVMQDGKYGYLIPGTTSSELKKAFVKLEKSIKRYKKFDACQYQEQAQKQLINVLFGTN